MTRILIDLIDKASVVKLRKLLGTRSDSETVRAAVQHRLRGRMFVFR